MKNKLIYVLIFLLGGIVFATGTKLYLDAKNRPTEVVQAQPNPKKKSFFGKFFDDDFFGEEVLDQMAQSMAGMDNLGEVARLETSESDQYVTYEIFLDLIDKNALKIDIKDGQITLSGQARIEKENKGDFGVSKSISVSSFTRSFPVPQGVKAEEVQIEHKEKSIVLKFPKTPRI